MTHATRLLPERHHAVALTEGHVRWLPPWSTLDPGFTGLFSRLREPAFGDDFVVARNAFIEDVLFASLPKLSAAERDSYRHPFAHPGRRHAILALAREVPVDGDPPSIRGVLAAVSAALADPRLPTLLLKGTPGAVIDADAVAWIEQHASDLSCVDIGSARHVTPEEQPEAIAAAVSAWASA